MFDNIRELDSEDIQFLSAPEMGYLLYLYPLSKLLKFILDGNIDGPQFIKNYKTKQRILREETGWKNEEIYQIEAILFRYLAIDKEEFKSNSAKITTSIPPKITTQIKEKILKFDHGNVSKLHLKIKQGHQNILTFSQ